MERKGNVTRIPIQLTHGCLVASIQVDLSEEILEVFQRELLDRIHAASAAGVILDVSGVELMDAEDFEALRSCIAMASVMGARCMLVGLQPGVVSALIDLEVDVSGIEATIDLEEAFRLLTPAPVETQEDRAELASDADEAAHSRSGEREASG